MNIIVTGGAGYIGSTVANCLKDAGHTPIILDSLAVGREEFTQGQLFYKGDIADRALLEKIFAEHAPIYCVIHCAALTSVPESVSKPYEYYRENVVKSLELYKNLGELGCARVVFSSSASLYDNVPGFKVTEDSPLKAVSPYGRTKLMMEMVLQDLCAAGRLRGIALRYFNPVGADPKMRTGHPNKESTLLISKLVAAAEQQKEFCVTGVDWPTRDGTGIRDYFHVWDLARAHVLAVENFDKVLSSEEAKDGYLVINLGLGGGVTVREFVDKFMKVYGKSMRVTEGPPRPGDVAGAYASSERAKRLLGWEPELTIEQGIADSLKWNEVRAQILGK